MSRARRRGNTDSRCPACGAHLLTQWVGHTAALHARVDLPPPGEPRPYPAAVTDATPQRLVWCLPRPRHGPLRLRWTSPGHPPDCPHQHLLDHQCPPAEPTTIF
ncbi:hypothetical protein [Streptomyces sp. L2]|uniref:hypothetical protein n=1 Tax=Streptomyces sp. L2 TaxID=2162665 RepID=UPI0010105F2D|nr:hypothetical protein [Streptomyces sp. L2]